MRILRAADREALPWKNGGGITREVMAWPAGAGMDDFHWRVSMAEVREAGPFSRFENVDRILAVLQGHLVLTFTDFEIDIQPGDDPFPFAGDEPCEGRPIGGPVMDLNVMVRWGNAFAHVARAANSALRMTADWTLIVATSDASVVNGNEQRALAPFDAALIEGNAEVTLRGEAYVIRIA
jgi:environmental stress-induced protein Ves